MIAIYPQNYKNNRSFVRESSQFISMLYYLKNYPLTLTIVAVICYLSFFTPPDTNGVEIPYMDKLVHICMYGGLCLVIWFEYLRQHKSISFKRMLIGGIISPICMSGCIELLQEHCTENRGGDWADLVANIIGIISAAGIGYYILRPFFNKKRNAGYSHERPTQ